MIYKYINEHAVKAFCGWWKVGDTVVTNSEAEPLAVASGEWFPLVTEDEPEYDPETQYLSFHYEKEADAIRKVWDVFDIPDEATEADYEAALGELGVKINE